MGMDIPGYPRFFMGTGWVAKMAYQQTPSRLHVAFVHITTSAYFSAVSQPSLINRPTA